TFRAGGHLFSQTVGYQSFEPSRELVFRLMLLRPSGPGFLVPVWPGQVTLAILASKSVRASLIRGSLRNSSSALAAREAASFSSGFFPDLPFSGFSFSAGGVSAAGG